MYSTTINNRRCLDKSFTTPYSKLRIFQKSESHIRASKMVRGGKKGDLAISESHIRTSKRLTEEGKKGITPLLFPLAIPVLMLPRTAAVYVVAICTLHTCYR